MPAQRQGRGKGLSRSVLIAAALDIVDGEGLGALSMRRLGAELDVDPMAAYRHFPSKDALLDGVLEAVVGDMDFSTDGQASWQDQLRQLALSNREAILRHPNALPLLTTRPLTTPGSLRLVEKALEITTSAGVPLRDGALAINATGLFTAGFATAVAASARDTRSREDLRALTAALPTDQFPHMHEALKTGQVIEGYEQIYGFFIDALIAHLERIAAS